MEFTAADFNWNEEGSKFWFDVVACDTRVEVSRHGDNAWVELEIEDVPELWRAPGWGTFYRADLSQVKTAGWHDVRFTLVDAVGNKVVQTLGPVFSIGEGSIDDAVAESDPEAQPEYYNMQGQRVERPGRGHVYIERRGGRVAKVVM